MIKTCPKCKKDMIIVSTEQAAEEKWMCPYCGYMVTFSAIKESTKDEP